MKEEDLRYNKIKNKLNDKTLSDAQLDKINKICGEWYIGGYKQGRFDEQMEFLQQAEKQLSIVKEIKKFLIENKNFKVLHYVEKLERERK